MIEIAICNEQDLLPLDEDRWRRVVTLVLEEAGIRQAAVSVAVVDDAAIHELNRRYLAHDEPTDVLSFLLESGPAELEGEIVASAQTACRAAEEWGWPAADELLLYVVHGALHLVGYDDLTEPARTEMFARQREVLARMGVAEPEGARVVEDARVAEDAPGAQHASSRRGGAAPL